MSTPADPHVLESGVPRLCENGLAHRDDAVRLILNEAMRIERSQGLAAAPYQRTEKMPVFSPH